MDATAINDSGPARSAAPITLENVGKTYPDGTVAVGDFSLEVRPGELAVLIGPSGCGKSTILRMINRLIEPTKGRILVDGRNILEQDPNELRRHIGYVIQNVGLFPHQNIRTNIGKSKYDSLQLEFRRRFTQGLLAQASYVFGHGYLSNFETLRSPERIERMATGRLRMVAPSADDAIVIERVIQTPAPPRSVVARR